MSPLLVLFSLLSVCSIANSVGIPLFLSIPGTGEALTSFSATDDQQNRTPFSHRCSSYASSAVLDKPCDLVPILPLHPSLAPLWSSWMRSFSFKCLFTAGRESGKPLVEGVQARDWPLIVASKLFLASKLSSTNNWQLDLVREHASSFS